MPKTGNTSEVNDIHGTLATLNEICEHLEKIINLNVPDEKLQFDVEVPSAPGLLSKENLDNIKEIKNKLDKYLEESLEGTIRKDDVITQELSELLPQLREIGSILNETTEGEALNESLVSLQDAFPTDVAQSNVTLSTANQGNNFLVPGQLNVKYPHGKYSSPITTDKSSTEELAGVVPNEETPEN